ncbi:ASCH domain-containing protein [Aquabacter sp. CN5-332]|uniref:ASCH domain-containing protein n=1 Tax=Aquabacter sp. CN5-332 TaxID=3156608 RepID=UPI0032B3185C
MKAFSIIQPWAWLIVNGHKDVENRKWKPWNPGLHFRGEVLIHAGKKFNEDALAFVRGNFPQIVLPETFDRGGIVGKAVIIDAVTEHESPWFFGPYAFVLTRGEPLPFLPCKGALGFFTPTFDPPEPAPAPTAAVGPAQGSLL